ncbi:circularly permuted type 2 ATP-grasp protein [Pseudomonas sp. UL073]|uniref:Circularly permuted type 2 ATP-grasp protein n=1 Tax=Zestomonas insulae TaxID=2809017 RepID=A0ABS2IH50_9GAMM|nr:circularly permuted type 2 ATP-grasp protein [Pseudomonas insulae]MBM7061250.1 circularly permuted type 2 ATP-grasp protein [Pseudomonas insulae]
MTDLLAHYPLTPATYHELLRADGSLRPHWQRLFRQLERSGAAQLRQRQALVARQIQENGVTYNVYADPKGTDRPWELDLLPNLLSAEEWQPIAAGVAQRARLLNALLGDLYGEQQLLRDGLLPSELVFGHPNFLWPCQGVRPVGGVFLHSYAVDLARDAGGRWQVLADRTQAPSGAGYALENRQIVSRAFPELYRDLRVQYLAGYFRTLQETLSRHAPCEGETPLVVLLTPGRFNETYFEHLYLARQLGFPLVEGHDLTVRDDTLYLKTLGGLKRVHAVLRRLDDDFCDPLELRTDSALGVPGLLAAVRRGRVLVANALGSGVLESPGLLGFLPQLSQRLIGETLLLPSVDSRWLGSAGVLDATLARLGERVIKPAFPSQSFEPLFGQGLDAEGLAALAERLRARPHNYVAQAQAQLSQAPIWQGGELQARAIGMRVFAVASADGQYWVMPGGLTRVAARAGAEVVSMQRGGASKDTWVLTDQPVHGEPLRPRNLGVRDLIRQDPYLPSRVVENLYWFGRYSERCDDGARLLRVVLARYVDADGDDCALQSALNLGERLGLLPPAGEAGLERRLLKALCGDDWPFSLRANLRRLHWAAAQVRGRLSQENWNAVLELQREAQSLDPAHADLGEGLDSLSRLVMSLAALSGFALDDMTRDDGWRFLMIGRRIERVQFFAESLAAFLRGGTVWDAGSLEWLLELGNSTITYRSRYLASPQLIPVLDLLLLHDQNPHALRFQLQAVERTLARLNRTFGVPQELQLSGLIGRLLAFDLATLENPLFGASGLDAVLLGLADLLQEIAQAAGQISDRLELRYFAHIDDISQQTVSA